jgi:hypothetical protein
MYILRNFFILSFILLVSDIFAQRDKHYIGFSISPSYTYRYIADLDGDHYFLIEHRNNNERPVIMGSAGFISLWSLESRLNIETGVQYTVYGDKVDVSNQMTFDPDHGFVLPDKDDRRLLISEMHFITLPVLANVYLNGKRSKFAFFISAGLSAHFFLYRVVDFKQYNDAGLDRNRERWSKENVPARDVSLAAIGGFGVDWNYSGKSRIRMAPFYQQFTHNMLNSDVAISEKPFSTGIQFAWLLSL